MLVAVFIMSKQELSELQVELVLAREDFMSKIDALKQKYNIQTLNLFYNEIKGLSWGFDYDEIKDSI